MLKILILLILALNQCAIGVYRHDEFVRLMHREQAAKFKGAEVPLSEYSTQMNNTPNLGLPKCFKCLNIGVIGAGVSGLTAGVELARAGHRVTIYEGSSRVGGRVLTYRQPGTNYVTELGAMRLPLEAHPFLKYYIDKRYNLLCKEFLNSDPNAMVYVNAELMSVQAANSNPEKLGFRVQEKERGLNADQLWAQETKPLLEMIETQGYDAFVKEYGSYSIDQYLTNRSMSRAAIDYVGLMLNIETNLYTSLTEAIADMQIIKDNTTFCYIEGGNDKLTEALKNECLSISDGRCKILYDHRIVTVDLHDTASTDVGMEYTTSTSMSANATDRYHTVIVATTATAAALIEFKVRDLFVAKYRALRQAHYDCASKVSLFFKKAWWRDLGIKGGRSTTDLPIRFAYYHNFNGSFDGGAAIIGSYTWSQDAIVWQSLPDNIAINLTLTNVNRLDNIKEIFSFSDGGKVQHWCNDPWSHGAFILFTPYQELHIKEALKKSVGPVHFIGEHTSSAHGWIEGAILSALRVALELQEESFDVVIIGGGPVGLATAINLAKRNNLTRIAVIEQNELGNSEGSSGSSDTRQFRQMYSELYLAELAIQSTKLWGQLEIDANLTNGTLLNTKSGYLFFGNPETIATTEGDLKNITSTCQNLNLGCRYLNSTELNREYPFFSKQQTYKGIFHQNSGYVNVTALLYALKTLAVQRNIMIRTNEAFLEFDQTVSEKENYVRLFTTRGSLKASKVVFVPGPFARNVSESLGFNLNMTMWELPTIYFQLRPGNYIVPTWFGFGDSLQALYYGFPAESSDRPGYIKISPDFIKNMSNPLLYPVQRRNSADPWLIEQTREWVRDHLPFVDPDSGNPADSTCLATFLPDNGFLLDYLPIEIRYHDKVLMYAGGWGMKFVPIWADILSDLVVNQETTKYKPYLQYLTFNRTNIWSPIRNSTPPVSESVSMIPNRELSFSLLLVYVLISIFILQ